ncbi:TorF family putative porin [Pseudomonas sp. RIT-PI-S]|uniref:TorF family putative porin n=1 Tax=Pseudomonas sp. RIT-PI-S TaxID=3035295 RepID=UPI0021D8A4B6|nr:TorF family putative porin [Pseudomonas sp. RIT-PI-S]
MLKPSLLLTAGLLAAPHLNAQTLQRELGDFDLKLGTTPTRSMAQGLVAPGTVGSVHGGIDVTHDSGWYFGQWSPSVGLTPDSDFELDSYLGYKRRVAPAFGYELGMIGYTRPDVANGNSHQLYAGMRVFESRFGAAWSEAVGSRSGTLFADLGQLPLVGLDLSLKMTRYSLASPYSLGNGELVEGYSDWSMQVSRPLMGVDLNLVYSASDLRGGACVAYSGHNPTCDSMVTLKAQRTFF